jgi:hypothetical protein
MKQMLCVFPVLLLLSNCNPAKNKTNDMNQNYPAENHYGFRRE